MKDEEKIKSIIEDLRPYLNMEGGDIEFIKYDDKEKIVYVRMVGACANCMIRDNDLEYGLLEAIKDEIPDVKKVINSPI